jgi:hemolysin III
VGAFVAAVPAAVVLVMAAGSDRARAAAAIYGASLIVLFGVSGAYHRLGHRGGGRPWMRRADHASIYGLIAGSYTPVALLAIGGWFGWALLIGVWTVAAAGMLLKLVWFDRTQIAGWVLYLGLGWVALSAIPSLVGTLSTGTLVLLAAGGLSYTLGAIILGRRWPDPMPRVFGYHEVWHTMVIVAAAPHFIAILRIVRAA